MNKKLLTAIWFTTFFIINHSYAKTVTYDIETTHSFVEFQYNHMGYSNPTGKLFATGTIGLDQKDLTKSNANITININGINTGIPKLDEHLLGSDFFNVSKFPVATFVSNKVTNVHGKSFDLVGSLTIHGISKPITLHVIENMQGLNKMTKLESAGFSATAVLKRSDFGIGKYVPMVSDDIKLNIEVEAYIPNDKKQ